LKFIVFVSYIYKSGKIICVSNSSELVWRNIKSITKFESLKLSTYLIRTYIINIDNFRLKLKSPVIIRILFKFRFVFFR